MTARTRPAQHKSAADRLTVLVVEDEPLLAFEFSDELALLGHKTVGPVMAGRDVMAAREERRLDLALVDIHLLDGPTGIDVGRYLGIHGIPYAFFTATPEVLPPDLAGAIGAVGKPCAGRELHDVLKYLCDVVSGSSEYQSRPLSVLLPQPHQAAPENSRTIGGRGR